MTILALLLFHADKNSMKSNVLLAFVAYSSLSACGDRPPPIVGPSHQFSAGAMIPTKMVPIGRQTLCPTWYEDVTVDLAFILEADGSVSHIRVLNESKKDCGFGENAAYAFRQWKFAPYLENGVPVAHESTYQITYKTADHFF